MEVDIARKRIALSMKSDPFAERGKKMEKNPLPSPKISSKPPKEEEQEGTMADKLAMLKKQFGK
jgi:uncharacterized protein